MTEKFLLESEIRFSGHRSLSSNCAVVVLVCFPCPETRLKLGSLHEAWIRWRPTKTLPHEKKEKTPATHHFFQMPVCAFVDYMLSDKERPRHKTSKSKLFSFSEDGSPFPNSSLLSEPEH